jgi:hypothetical protein
VQPYRAISALSVPIYAAGYRLTDQKYAVNGDYFYKTFTGSKYIALKVRTPHSATL